MKDLNQAYEEELARLEKYKKSKERIEAQIRRSESRKAMLEKELKGQQFDEATHVLHTVGLSMQELLAAIQKGDLESLRDKIQSDSATPVAPEEEHDQKAERGGDDWGGNSV